MNDQHPPKWAIKLVNWYSHPDFVQEIIGDLEEMYTKWALEKGVRKARLLYIWNAFLFIRSYNSRFSLNSSKFNQPGMISHSIKISLRNMRKHKSYNIGNVLGLAIGVSMSLMIFIHIDRELSYEKTYTKHERIYRVSSSNTWAQSPPSFAEEMGNFFPEIEQVTRFARYGGYRGTCVLSVEDNQFLSTGVFQVDESVIDVFDIYFLEGNQKGSLSRPYTIVLTETIAKKLFENENPVGKLLEINNEERKFEITGVIADLSKKSHIKAEVFVSMPTFYEQIPEEWTSSRGWMVMHTYALINKEENVSSFYDRMSEFPKQYFDEESAEHMKANGQFFEIMPLTDIHLKSDRTGEMETNSDISYIYIFGTLAVFIIIIASVNFINIFTTLAFKRIKEVGIRKIVGAQRIQLISQLLVEACVTALIAAFIGLTVCIIFLPQYNSIASLDISWVELMSPTNLILIFGSSMLLGLISGTYPALLVTRQKLSESILKNTNPKASISIFRKGLIVFQFALSLFILIATVVVNRQMNFIQQKDLGYDTDQLITMKMYGDLGRDVRKHYKTYFATLEKHPSIHKVSMASNVVGESLSREYFRPAEADPEVDYGNTHMLWADEKYLDVMGIELIRGRDFRWKTDTSVAFLVNQKLIENWDGNGLGTIAKYREETGPIVGVFEDVNFYSLHSGVEPMAICLKPSWSSNLLFKISGEHPIQTMEYIESTIRERSPNAIVQFNFVDDKLHELYAEETNMFSVFKVFSILALIISCLGLLGIAAIEVQRRTKEVGIRKVLGASASEILLLLSKQFSFMLAIAILISVPVSYFFSQKWLADYSYRVSLTGSEFFFPSLGLIVVAMLVVSLHAIKVMRSNPTESLRYE